MDRLAANRITPTLAVLPLIAAIGLFIGLYPLAGLMLRDDGAGLTVERKAPDFELFDSTGQQVSLRDLRGSYVYLMFGFLRCDDVCHLQAALLAELAGLIGSEPRFLYLAMDSRHDQPSLLRSYFDSRGDNFISLHATDMRRMQSLASDFNAPFRVAGNPAGDSYSIDHPARIFLIDPDGRLHSVYHGQNLAAADLASDYRRLTGNSSE